MSAPGRCFCGAPSPAPGRPCRNHARPAPPAPATVEPIAPPAAEHVEPPPAPTLPEPPRAPSPPPALPAPAVAAPRRSAFEEARQLLSRVTPRAGLVRGSTNTPPGIAWMRADGRGPFVPASPADLALFDDGPRLLEGLCAELAEAKRELARAKAAQRSGTDGRATTRLGERLARRLGGTA